MYDWEEYVSSLGSRMIQEIEWPGMHPVRVLGLLDRAQRQ